MNSSRTHSTSRLEKKMRFWDMAIPAFWIGAVFVFLLYIAHMTALPTGH